MAKYKVEITVTLPKRTNSQKISAVISASAPVDAVVKMIDGILSDLSRRGTTIWYREYSRKGQVKGYQKPEKRLLISAIREDATDRPKAMAFPPSFSRPRITVELVKEEKEEEVKKEELKPEDRQMKLFAFGHTYVEADSADVEVPPLQMSKLDVDEIAKRKPKPEPVVYATFYRVFSPKGLKVFETWRPKSDDPIENDQIQAMLDKLRDSDAWLLTDGPPVTSLPKTAVKGEINITDLRGDTFSIRKSEALVDGNTAYIEVADAFTGAPPAVGEQPQSGGGM